MESEATFGQKMAGWRTERSLGLRAIAKSTGISTSYLHDVEHDRFLPGEEHVRAIANALGMPEGQLILERAQHFFEREGLDGEVAAMLLAAGELSHKEKDSLLRVFRIIFDERRCGKPLMYDCEEPLPPADKQ